MLSYRRSTAIRSAERHLPTSSDHPELPTDRSRPLSGMLLTRAELVQRTIATLAGSTTMLVVRPRMGRLAFGAVVVFSVGLVVVAVLSIASARSATAVPRERRRSVAPGSASPSPALEPREAHLVAGPHRDPRVAPGPWTGRTLLVVLVIGVALSIISGVVVGVALASGLS